MAKRCLLCATSPGGLALNPTGGFGTTSFVDEQWGQRWIKIDTSRVALTLARARIVGARSPYYLLVDSKDSALKEAEDILREPSPTLHGKPQPESDLVIRVTWDAGADSVQEPIPQCWRLVASRRSAHGHSSVL